MSGEIASHTRGWPEPRASSPEQATFQVVTTSVSGAGSTSAAGSWLVDIGVSVTGWRIGALLCWRGKAGLTGGHSSQPPPRRKPGAPRFAMPKAFTPPDAAIRLTALRKTYAASGEAPAKPALKGVDLVVRRGSNPSPIASCVEWYSSNPS